MTMDTPFDIDGPDNIPIEEGDELKIFGAHYHFERVDTDKALTFRPPIGASYGNFEIHTDTGSRKPLMSEFATIWREGNVEFIERPLGTEVRRNARALGLQNRQIKTTSPEAFFLMAMVRRYDANPCNKSDRALTAFCKMALADPNIAKLPHARLVPPTTFRRWLRERGTPGCRKTIDGISMRGRSSPMQSIHHPIEPVKYWAIRATHVRGDVTKNYDRYHADLVKINRGERLNRFFLSEDGTVSDKEAVYAKPSVPYKPISYKRFYKLCRRLRSSGYAAKTTRQGGYQRYGGGGISDMPTHIGEFAWMDEFTVPKVFFVDDTGIPIGQCTTTVLREPITGVVAAAHLSIGAASASTVLTTVLKANLPKQVPQHLLDIDPSLPWLRGKFATIGMDNSMPNHSHTVEQVLADHYIGVRYSGSGMARDKAFQERCNGVFIDLIYNQIADTNYDIARMRNYKFNQHEFFDPSKHVICSIQTGRRLLDLAVMTLNVTGSKKNDGRPPALIWKQKLKGRALDKIYDEEGFRNSIGNVEFGIQMTNAGIDKFSRHYTPGAVEMRRIIKQFDDGVRRAKGDIGYDCEPNTDDRKRPKHKVKCMYDPDDIGRIKVWNPYADMPAWEIFYCTDSTADGMPEWLHKRCLEFAKREALEYITPDQRAYVRAKLFEDIANVDANAAERERRVLAKAVNHPQVRKVFSQIVEIVDELPPEVTPMPPEQQPTVDHENAIGKRLDAHVATPRAQGKKHPAPPKMTKVRRAMNHSDQDDADAQKGTVNETNGASLSSPEAPLTQGSRALNHGPANKIFDHDSPKLQSTERPIKRRSALKWGDTF